MQSSSAPTPRVSSRPRSTSSSTRVRRAAPPRRRALAPPSRRTPTALEPSSSPPRRRGGVCRTPPKPTPGDRRGCVAAVPAGGHASYVIPFFSDVYLPEQRGTWAEVTDYRLYTANVSLTCAPPALGKDAQRGSWRLHSKERCRMTPGAPDAHRACAGLSAAGRATFAFASRGTESGSSRCATATTRRGAPRARARRSCAASGQT